MDWKLFQNLIMKLPNARPASGGKFVNCRCRECFDSLDPTSAHMYVRIPWDNDDVPWYYCQKCHGSGVVNQTKLIDWGIYDQSIAVDLYSYIKDYYSSHNKKYSNNTNNIHSIRNTIIEDNNNTRIKLQYLNNRLGTNLSIKDIVNLKIIPSLISFLNGNNISKYTRNYNIIKQLSDNFIGFLSVDNGSLNMRRIVDKGIVYTSIDKRYINYNIFDEDNYQRFYTIPSRVNLMKAERIKLHIAEGPMDIVSIYLNLRNKEEGIYSSIAGSNYLPVIMYFLKVLRLPNIELHVYPDNSKEGSLNVMNNLLYRIPDRSIPFYIHRNLFSGEKDFGVPLSNIQESITKIH